MQEKQGRKPRYQPNWMITYNANNVKKHANKHVHKHENKHVNKHFLIQIFGKRADRKY